MGAQGEAVTRHRPVLDPAFCFPAMPIITPQGEPERAEAEKKTADEELMMICGWGKCHRRFDRVMKKKPNVNFKNKDGMTPLHNAAACGSNEFVEKLLKAKADPNVVATADCMTPLDIVTDKINYEQGRDDRLNDFDQVMRLDDSATAVRPDLAGYLAVQEALKGAGGVRCLAFDDKPNITKDGAVNGGKADNSAHTLPGKIRSSCAWARTQRSEEG